MDKQTGRQADKQMNGRTDKQMNGRTLLDNLEKKRRSKQA